ncbi:hypothetical protein QBC40DRAFT_255539 [Triangularia verruculosa]|uniref:Uncharacterized protein n=1 Tax=Triangularia verruculosa TaxID=2587418 RepID=A0AAN6XJM8_9PEZI|nr:hypothetical protein QBC40DRAFT_255539 [Triangularia verruculosa]
MDPFGLMEVFKPMCECDIIPTGRRKIGESNEVALEFVDFVGTNLDGFLPGAEKLDFLSMFSRSDAHRPAEFYQGRARPVKRFNPSTQDFSTYVSSVRSKLDDGIADKLIGSTHLKPNEGFVTAVIYHRNIMLGAIFLRTGAKIKHEDLQFRRRMVHEARFFLRHWTTMFQVFPETLIAPAASRVARSSLTLGRICFDAHVAIERVTATRPVKPKTGTATRKPVASHKPNEQITHEIIAFIRRSFSGKEILMINWAPCTA